MEQTETIASTEKLWNFSYVLVLTISTFSSISFYMIATFLSKYLVELGVGIAFAGFVVGLFSITSLVCRPFCGFMADRFSNVRLLLVSNVLMSIGLLGFALTDSMPLMILFRVCNGVGFAISGTVQVSLAVRFIPTNRTGEGVGYLGISQLIGSACAPALGLAIAERFGMPTAFIIAAALPLLGSALLIFLRDLPTPAKTPTKRIALRDIFEAKAIPFTIPYSTLSFTNGVISGYLLLFAEGQGIGKVGTYFTVYAVAVFLIRPFAGKLMDRRGLRYTVFPGLLLCAASLFFLSVSTSFGMILISGLLRAVGQGAAQPSLQAGSINHVGRSRSGVATSTYFLGGDVGQGIGPMVGGFLLARVTGLLGYQLLFSLCGVLVLAALGYFYIMDKKAHFR
jgi:MFS family permease